MASVLRRLVGLHALRMDLAWPRSLGVADPSLRPLGIQRQFLVLDSGEGLGPGVGGLGRRSRIRRLVASRLERTSGHRLRPRACRAAQPLAGLDRRAAQPLRPSKQSPSACRRCQSLRRWLPASVGHSEHAARNAYRLRRPPRSRDWITGDWSGRRRPSGWSAALGHRAPRQCETPVRRSGEPVPRATARSRHSTTGGRARSSRARSPRTRIECPICALGPSTISTYTRGVRLGR